MARSKAFNDACDLIVRDLFEEAVDRTLTLDDFERKVKSLARGAFHDSLWRLQSRGQLHWKNGEYSFTLVG